MKKLIYIRAFLFSVSAFVGLALNAQDYKLPAYQQFTLKNGLTVYLMEQHDVPMISVSAILTALGV